MSERFEVVVVGGGHAGLEAAAAAARLGVPTALVSLDPAALGRMSCNPAIGGIGKGQLAREVDALGGWMGLLADEAGIQFRMLNTRKGRAVRSPRAQCHRLRYERAAQRRTADQAGLTVVGGEAVDLLWRAPRPGDPEAVRRAGRAVDGVLLAGGRELRAGQVVLTTGTFLEGVLHTGEEQQPGGRIGEAGARRLGDALRALGLPTGRLKTGTPPRLATASVDLASLEEQPGDPEPQPFSFLTDRLHGPWISCWQTWTTEETHALVRANLHRAPMYAGRIQGRGPRYCPSLEDKVVRFADRPRHLVFLEPEGHDSGLLYANGISTSLPADIQERLVRTLPGCERAEIVQPGYAVEYTFVRPRVLRRSLELRDWPGLFLAGQICGTSGYEEAAAQGLIAGANAALRALEGADWEPFVPGREEAYIGVLVDDLVVSDPDEPYRMFTSRAEHRLLLRHDNADLRLTPLAAQRGLVGGERVRRLEARRRRLGEARRRLREQPLPGEAGRRLEDLLRRPGMDWEAFLERIPEARGWGLSRADGEGLVADVQYEGYVRRQEAWVARSREREARRIPDTFDFRAVPGLRHEAREALERLRPETLGAAGRLAAISPADLGLLEIALWRHEGASREEPEEQGRGEEVGEDDLQAPCQPAAAAAPAEERAQNGGGDSHLRG